MRDLESDIIRRYFRILKAFVWGFAQIFQYSVRRSRCITASIGSCPVRKYRAGSGETRLSFRIPRNILVWNLVRVFMTGGLIGREFRPERRTGLTYRLHTCSSTDGGSLHL